MKIITVTLNPCLDVNYYLSSPFKAGELNRAEKKSSRYSGKGINVSRRLHELGTESLALTFSFGSDGESMEKALRAEGLSLFCVTCPGSLRQNTAVLDCDGNATEINEKGSTLPEDKIKELISFLKSELNCPDDKLLVISGSIPPGVGADIYKKLCIIGKNSGAYVVLDCDGEALKTGLRGNPDLIKPNRRELSQLCGVCLDAEGEQVRIDAVRAALELYRNEAVDVLCTLDCDGAVYAGREGSFMCQAIKGDIKSFKGAGDAYLASFLREFIIRRGEAETAMIKAAAETTAALCGK